MNYFTELFGLF